MNRKRKIGIVLILIGIGLPIVLLMFTTGGSSRGIIDDIQDRKILLWTKWKSVEAVPPSDLPEHLRSQDKNKLAEDIFDYVASKISDTDQRNQFRQYVLLKEKQTGRSKDQIVKELLPEEGKAILEPARVTISFPYKYILAFGVVSLFIGIGLTILSNKKGE